jgi:hypothetical protein
MKKAFYLFVIVLALASCEQKPSLQKYYVDKAGSKNFTVLDVAPTFINTDKLTLSAEEKMALKSVRKFNVLVFKEDASNKKVYEAERKKVAGILKEDQYEELMHIGSNEKGVSISSKGDGEHIDEFAVFVHQRNNGFGVIRVMGEDMNPNNVLNLMSLLQKADIKMDQLKPLQELMTKK